MPSKLDPAAMAECARILQVPPGCLSSFEKLVTSLPHISWERDATHKTELLKTGRAFVRALKRAPTEISWPIEEAIMLAELRLTSALDEMKVKPGPRKARLPRERFIILLCCVAEEAGGTLSASRLGELLDTLKPHLPVGFSEHNEDSCRRLLKKARTLRQFSPRQR